MKGDKTVFIFCQTSANKNNTDNHSDNIDYCISMIADGGAVAETAMSELYSLTCSSVYGFALSILKNSYDAEDVLHDCYVLIYSAAESYHSVGKPMAWILTIVKNLALKKLREQRKSADLPPEEVETDMSIGNGLLMEDKQIISACLEKLSDEERQIVVLHAVSGFKHREISGFLKLPLSTVLSKYNRALKKLRKIFEGEETI